MSDVAAKRKRVRDALEHREPDKVPVFEGFWTNFVRRCKEELEVGPDFNPYAYWDLDMAVAIPNMDPHITGVKVLENSPEKTVVKTGFGATIERHSTHPMPHYNAFDTQTYEQMEALVFDDPKDSRRYYEAIDDQINSVGDAINLDLPPFVERVKGLAEHVCVFGSVCEPHEMIWRIMGTENVLYKLGEDPGRMAAFIEKLGDFLVGIAEGQIEAAGDQLDGIIIWGDIAYDRGMFFSPDYWRSVYMPQLKRICDTAHAAGLKTVYHGCGDARAVFEDMIEAGVDAYNPLEAKAGLDAVELKRQYGNRLGWVGNMNVQVLATNDREKVRREVVRKLNAAKGGGFIAASDHSMPDNVDPQTYAYFIELIRTHGTYPLDLGEFDEAI